MGYANGTCKKKWRKGVGRVKSKYLFLVFVGIVLIISSMTLYYFQNLYLKNYDSYLNYKQDNVNKTMISVMDSYTDFSDYIFKTSLNTKKICKMMWEADQGGESEKLQIKDELYDMMLDMYTTTTDYNFGQLQFIDAEGASFLRLNAPLRYGDDLTTFRKSISLIVKNHEKVTGYEAGRIVDGYRFVYPLFYNSEFVGCVELEVSMSMVVSKLNSTFENSDVGFIVGKN